MKLDFKLKTTEANKMWASHFGERSVLVSNEEHLGLMETQFL